MHCFGYTTTELLQGECLARGAGSQLMTQVRFSTELTLKTAPSHTIPEELRIAGLKK